MKFIKNMKHTQHIEVWHWENYTKNLAENINKNKLKIINWQHGELRTG